MPRKPFAPSPAQAADLAVLKDLHTQEVVYRSEIKLRQAEEMRVALERYTRRKSAMAKSCIAAGVPKKTVQVMIGKTDWNSWKKFLSESDQDEGQE